MIFFKGNVLIKNLNFNEKKDIDVHTKLNPSKRYERLRAFLEKISKHPESAKHLRNWDMEFSQDTVKVTGKVMDKIEISYVIFKQGYFFFQLFYFYFVFKKN